MSELIFVATSIQKTGPLLLASWVPMKILTVKSCLRLLLKINFINVSCLCYLSPETVSIWKTRHLLLPCLHMKLKSQLSEWKYRNKNSRTLILLLAPMLNDYFISVKPGPAFCFKCQPITLNELKTFCLSEISKMTGRHRGCSASTIHKNPPLLCGEEFYVLSP